jgi:hypothetical protein
MNLFVFKKISSMTILFDFILITGSELRIDFLRTTAQSNIHSIDWWENSREINAYLWADINLV